MKKWQLVEFQFKEKMGVIDESDSYDELDEIKCIRDYENACECGYGNPCSISYKIIRNKGAK